MTLSPHEPADRPAKSAPWRRSFRFWSSTMSRTPRPLAEALVAGGLPVLEVTLRTPAALDAIRAMAQVPGGHVGAGTLVTPEDVRAAKEAGATFGVSPGATDELLAACEAEDLPLLARCRHGHRGDAPAGARL